jgi:hypothetical protein
MRLVRYPDFLTLLQVVPQLFLVTDIVMTVTIHLKAILMVETAVHLMKMGVGINFVPYVNVFSPLARTIGQRKNATRNVMQKSVWNPNHVRRTAGILVIYVEFQNLVRIKKAPSFVRSNWKRGNVVNQVFGRNVRRHVTHAN